MIENHKGARPNLPIQNNNTTKFLSRKTKLFYLNAEHL